jgi:hypothetical protein
VSRFSRSTALPGQSTVSCEGPDEHTGTTENECVHCTAVVAAAIALELLHDGRLLRRLRAFLMVPEDTGTTQMWPAR